MENPTDDPREFHRGGPDLGGDAVPLGLETFLSLSILTSGFFISLMHILVALQGLAAERGAPDPRTTRRSPEPIPRSSVRILIPATTSRLHLPFRILESRVHFRFGVAQGQQEQ
jgi:hypothetical protein